MFYNALKFADHYITDANCVWLYLVGVYFLAFAFGHSRGDNLSKVKNILLLVAGMVFILITSATADWSGRW